MSTSVLPTLSIVVVTYKSRSYIADCLASLVKYAPKFAHEIFVVDNGSQDQTVEFVRQHYPQVQVLVNRENEGFARANNRALARARGKFVLLLNPDAQVSAGALEALVARAEKLPKLGALAPKLVYPDKS